MTRWSEYASFYVEMAHYIGSTARRTGQRRRRALAVVLALVICGGIFTTMNLADRLVLFPQVGPITASGAERRLIGAGQDAIEVWVARSRPHEEPKAYALRFYGNADRAERWIVSEAQSYRSHSLELWGVNYPGFGGSGGSATLAGVARAGTQAFDAISALAGEKPVFVIGTSIGTTAALHVAANRPVAGCVLQNPPALREIIVGDHGWWNLWLLAYPISRQVPSELDSIANASRAKAPAIFLSAENDEIVPPKYQKMVIAAYAGPKRVISVAGARHNDALPPAIGKQLHSAFSQLLARSAVPSGTDR